MTLSCVLCLQVLFARNEGGKGIPFASGQWLCPDMLSSHMSFSHLGDRRKAKAAGAKEPINKTEKPPEFIERLLASFTNQRDTVIDYTAGSGAMVKHAMALGRNVVAYEMDERQYTYLKGVVQDFVTDRRHALSRPIKIQDKQVEALLQPVDKLQPRVFPALFSDRVLLDVGDPPQSVLFTVRPGKHVEGEGGVTVSNSVAVPLVGAFCLFAVLGKLQMFGCIILHNW